MIEFKRKGKTVMTEKDDGTLEVFDEKLKQIILMKEEELDISEES